MRRVTAEGKMHGDAAPHSLWQRLVPSGLLRGEIEHAEMPGLLLQKSAPELVRILLRQCGQFVHKTFDCEGGMRMPDGTQPLHWDVHFSLMRFHRYVWNGIWKVVYPFDGHGIVLLALHHHRSKR